MTDFTSKIFLYFVIVLSAVIHEYSHAFMANELGDDTAREMGRLSLNPIRHIDIMGTVLVPLFLMFTSGIFIGWAKPVPFNPLKLKGPKDELKVALAGPASNLAIAVIMSGLFFVMKAVIYNSAIVIAPFVALIIQVNISLALFNLIPVPPLDGSRLIGVVLPFEWTRRFERLGILGIVIALWIGMMVIPYAASFVFYIVTGFGRLFS
ncbi:MAG: site-2 protease family protein [Candidatus Colwellbacteria bacterium]|nr:site-2 protease family protein [Candidatus Colwellbacteria bacterium]